MTALAQVAIHGGAAALSLAAGSLVAAVWQGILLAALVGLGLRLLPKTPAAVRFAIWFGVFVIVTALPLALLWPHAAGSASGIGAGRGAWLVLDEGWTLAIVAVWAVASLVRAGTLVAAALRVRALWKRARPVKFDPTHDDETVVNGAPGLGRRAELCVSDEVDRPTVIGFFSPKILIPGWLMEKLTPAELEQVVLHERGHLGRADDWLNLLQKIALVVFPLNPALAWVERRLCLERELAVDERVLEAVAGRAGAAKAYARCLTTLAEYRLERNVLRRGLALVLGALGRESELGRRVGRILEPKRAMRPAQARLVLGGAALGLLVAAGTLERCPQVVGFAARDQGTGIRDQGTANREQAAMPLGGFRAQAVVARMDAAAGQPWKTAGDAVATFDEVHKNNPMQSHVKVTHEVDGQGLAATAQSAGDGFAAVDVVKTLPAEAGTDGSERMVQTVAQAKGQPTRGDEAAKDEPPVFAEAQWTVVVTRWRVDGMVMMTEEFSSGVPMQVRANQGSPQMPEQLAPSTARNGVVPEQMRQRLLPYEVVPVRGGWLVIQL